MTYDPAELAPRDVIRGMAGDTDTTSEILPDARYDAVLVRHGVGAEIDTAAFYRAAAEMLRRVANTIDQKLIAISNPDAGSITWSANRSKGLRDEAARLDAQAAELEAGASGWGAVLTVKSDYLTGSAKGESW